MSIKISSQFDAGAIEVVNATSANAIDLNIRKDSHADIIQWFYFRLQGAQGQACTIRFLNAGQAAYPAGWEGYQAMASYDRINWFRVPTSYDGKVMSIEHTPGMDSVYYAYFEPYSWERHLELLDRAQMSEHVRMLDLGSTVDGRDLNMLVIGEPSPEKKKVWVIARQHPGETMAEWFVEGMLDALLDPAHPFGRQLLKESVFYVVPNMNPDGSVRGNLRTNAAGANLNREWMNPTMERSPEVFLCSRRCTKPASTSASTCTATRACPTSSWPAANRSRPGPRRRPRSRSSSWKTSRSPARTSRTCTATARPRSPTKR